MKLETLSLKTTINRLYFFMKAVILFNETSEKKTSAVACNQFNRKSS